MIAPYVIAGEDLKARIEKMGFSYTGKSSDTVDIYCENATGRFVMVPKVLWTTPPIPPKFVEEYVMSKLTQCETNDGTPENTQAFTVIMGKKKL